MVATFLCIYLYVSHIKWHSINMFTKSILSSNFIGMESKNFVWNSIKFRSKILSLILSTNLFVSLFNSIRIVVVLLDKNLISPSYTNIYRSVLLKIVRNLQDVHITKNKHCVKTNVSSPYTFTFGRRQKKPELINKTSFVSMYCTLVSAPVFAFVCFFFKCTRIYLSRSVYILRFGIVIWSNVTLHVNKNQKSTWLKSFFFIRRKEIKHACGLPSNFWPWLM